ncbi:hypothetical protein Tco_0160206, partial [Tanacetum coccineum]
GAAVELSPTSYLDVRAVRHNLLRGGNSVLRMSSLRSTGGYMNSEAGSGDDGNGNDVGTCGGKCSDDGGGALKPGGSMVIVSGNGGGGSKARSLLTSSSDGKGIGASKRGHGQQRVQQHSRPELDAPPLPRHYQRSHHHLRHLHQLDSLLDHPQSPTRDPPRDPSQQRSPEIRL